MSDLMTRYLAEIERAGYTFDPAQAHALERIEPLRSAILDAPEPARGLRGWWARLRGTPPVEQPAGYYLYGGVGRGKTFVVDLFFESLPDGAAWRIHFHSFMHFVHSALKRAGEVADPLAVVGDEIAARARVVVLDEFHVTDITDAMLLARLLEVLAERRVALVTTSNDPPGELYAGGLQRERFLPAIDHLSNRFEVISFDGDTDYRLRQLTEAPVYLVPAGAEADAALAGKFEQLSRGTGVEGGEIEVDGRKLAAVRRAEHLAWFEFAELCEGPRSTRDYIELARRFETILVSGVPVFSAARDDAARRFMNMVDEFYDRRVKLIVSAEAEPDGLYRGQRLAAGFRRTASRLTEMRSEAFLHRAHLS